MWGGGCAVFVHRDEEDRCSSKVGKQRFTGDLNDNNIRADDVDVNGNVVLLFWTINPKEWKAGVRDDMTAIREEGNGDI